MSAAESPAESPAESIYFAALAKESPGARAAYLDEACGVDADLRRRVERLLQAQPKVGSFLQGVAGAPSATIAETEACESAGTLIGPYKLIEPIGEGGMGTVWMAQQQEPVKRVVAIKLIKAGMDSKQVLARFGAERQALALMDHPHIAKVLDAGTISDFRLQNAGLRSEIPNLQSAINVGRPYFVMELVKGVPITKYCDERHLTPRQRLELFIPVCQAIQHAHQKGVIHRDLKPSNVLVALYDGKPAPKVIDFGVAKAAGQPLTDSTLVTGFGHIVGTLEYMSPEQAEINQLDIDTRSDIYSLGVLLYELLTGGPPFRRKELEKAGMLEMLRVIREQEPLVPSTKLSTDEGLRTLAANRGTESAKLTRLMRGELDWIVMKALDKDRSRRYETANAFAGDLQRYLADEPVQAGPPSAAYRLRKFVRRHQGPVLAASLLFLALVAGVIGTTWGLILAEQQRLVVEGQRNELAEQNQALQAAHERERLLNERARQAIEAVASETAIDQLTREKELRPDQKEFLDKMIEYYAESAQEAAATEQERSRQARAYFRMGVMNQILSRLPDSETAYRRAVTLGQQLAADFPKRIEFRQQVAGSYANLGVVLGRSKNLTGAESAHADALAIYKQLAAGSPDRPEFRQAMAGVLNNLGNLLHGTGRPKEAEAAHAEALAIRKELLSKHPTPTLRRALAMSHNNLGWVFQSSGRLKEAESAYAEAVVLYKQAIPDLPTRPEVRLGLAQTYNNLSNVLRDTGRPKEAEAARAEALVIFRQLVAEFPNRPEFHQELADAERQ